MGRRPVALFGAALLVCAAVAVSCSDSSDDPVEVACRVVVNECKAMNSASECLDKVGYLSPPCVLCIANGDCSYFSECQRADPTCIMGPELKP